ncbi:MAG: thioesterase family protein [Porticoccus sp.]
MFKTTIEPRFSETDALGHINHTVFPIWFNFARKDLYKRVHPSLSLDDWPMTIGHFNIDIFHQTHYSSEVTINTGITKIGTKSFTVVHEAWQKGVMVARGETVLVWFDYKEQASCVIPENIRTLLAEH